MKKTLFLILALVLCLSLCACGDVTVNTYYFKELKYEKDDFSNVEYYFQDDGWGGVIVPTKINYVLNGFSETTYFLRWEGFSIFSVVKHEENADLPYRLECTLRFNEGEHNTDYPLFEFNSIVFSTDKHTYTIPNLIETNEKGVNIIRIGKVGKNMLEDIVSCEEVKIRLINTYTGDIKDIQVDSDLFTSALNTALIFEKCGCMEYNFKNYETKIEVE